MSKSIFIFLAIIFILIVILRLRMLSPKKIGIIGEIRVAWMLHWLPKKYIVLNDILLKTKYCTTQIDHVVVSPYGIFVIETKNYKGWIVGHEKSEEWAQSLLGKKRLWSWSSKQHLFRNPILQNQSHVEAIRMLTSEMGDFPIVPIVVFSDKATLKTTTPNHIVINGYCLKRTIKRFKKTYINDTSRAKIAAKIISANITDKDIRAAHIKSVQQIQKKKEWLIAEGICPICRSKLVERHGKYGQFLSCSNYPQCKYTSKL